MDGILNWDALPVQTPYQQYTTGRGYGSHTSALDMSSVDLHIHMASQDNSQQSIFMHHILLRCLFKEKSVDCWRVCRMNVQYTFQTSCSYVYFIASIDSNGAHHKSLHLLIRRKIVRVVAITNPEEATPSCFVCRDHSMLSSPSVSLSSFIGSIFIIHTSGYCCQFLPFLVSWCFRTIYWFCRCLSNCCMRIAYLVAICLLSTALNASLEWSSLPSCNPCFIAPNVWTWSVEEIVESV